MRQSVPENGIIVANDSSACTGCWNPQCSMNIKLNIDFITFGYFPLVFCGSARRATIARMPARGSAALAT
jgi:hypothetical protein